MSEYINLAVPFFSQRENIYEWHGFKKEVCDDKTVIALSKESKNTK